MAEQRLGLSPHNEDFQFIRKTIERVIENHLSKYNESIEIIKL